MLSPIYDLTSVVGWLNTPAGDATAVAEPATIGLSNGRHRPGHRHAPSPSHPFLRRLRASRLSLIEIILVVVLIGGIVAFAANRILGGGDRAKVNPAKAQVQTLVEKIGQYEAGHRPPAAEARGPGEGAVGGRRLVGPYAKGAS